MSRTASKIKQIEALMAAGLSVSESIQKALDVSLSKLAATYGFRQNEVSMCLLAYHQRIYPDIRDAICKELEIPREYLDRLIDSQREPAEKSA